MFPVTWCAAQGNLCISILCMLSKDERSAPQHEKPLYGLHCKAAHVRNTRGLKINKSSEKHQF
jgi:hypothetical protein